MIVFLSLYIFFVAVVKRVASPVRPRIDPIYQEVVKRGERKWIGWNGEPLDEYEEYGLLFDESEDEEEEKPLFSYRRVCYACRRRSTGVLRCGPVDGGRVTRRFDRCGNSTCLKVILFFQDWF